MNRLIGLLIAAQALFTGIIVIAIYDLSDSVKESAVFINGGDAVLARGADHFTTLLVLGIVALIGILLGFKKN